MPLKIVRNDLTRMQVDAIVNTANEAPVYSTGTDSAVYKAAGEEALLEARRKIGYMNEGEVAITPGFRLPARFIIHAVSPRYIDGQSGEEEKLRSCYQKSLKMAYQYGCKSIAFPLIATGSFGYPKEEGMRIAVDEIHAFLLSHDMLVYIVVFGAKSTLLASRLYPDLEEYIDQNYVCSKCKEEYEDGYSGFVPRYEPDVSGSRSDERRRSILANIPIESFECGQPPMAPQSQRVKKSAEMQSVFLQEENLDEDFFGDFLVENETALKERLEHLSDTFQEYLMYLIESKHLSNAEVYKRAIVTKQLFSKIKLNPAYHPDKATAMRLCVGARLSLDETKDLLARAGYALSPCDKRDIIFSFFIENKVYDMIDIDIALEEHGLPCFIE